MDTAVNVERIEELVVRTADEAREEFLIDGGHTHDEVFLGQDCVKIIRCHHVRCDRKPEHVKLRQKYSNIVKYLG